MNRLGEDDAAERCARRQRSQTRREASGIDRMQTIDILCRIDGVDDGLCVQALRQRQLHQNAMHARIGIELCDQRQQIGLRRVRSELVLERRHARGFGLLRLVAHVDFGGRVIAHQHNREARREVMFTLHARHFIGDARAQVCGNDFSIDDFGRHQRSFVRSRLVSSKLEGHRPTSSGRRPPPPA